MKDRIAEKKYAVIKDYIWVFFICFLPRVIFCLFAKPLRTQSDEFSTMFFAAKLAGLQWDEVIEYANYYGIGMNLFTWWIYKLPISPIVKYKCLLGFCAILQSLVGTVCLKILNILNMPNLSRKIRMVISVLCSFMVFTRHTVYYNENALILITWLIALIFVNLIVDNGSKYGKMANSIVLAFVLAFSFLVHTRSLTYVLALIVLEVLYFIMYKTSLIHIRGFLSVFVVGYIGASYFLDWYQGNFWTKGIRAITNASIPNVVSGEKFTVRNITTMIQVIFSQFTTASLLTGGICLIGIVVLVILLFQELFLKRQKLEGSKRAIFVIGLYTFMCAGATSLYQALAWGPGVACAIYEDGDLYSLKALTYIRYIGPYMGIIFLVGLLYIQVQEYTKVKRIYMVSLAIFVGLLFWWIRYIIPLIGLVGDTSEAFICFVLEEPFIKGETHFLIGAIVSMMLAGICSILLLKNKRKWITLVIGLFLIYQYMYNAAVYDVQIEEKRYEKVDASYELFENLETEGVFVDKDLYVVDEKQKKDHMFFFQFQIYMEQYIVHPNYPEKGDNIVLITNSFKKTKKNLDIEDYTVFVLDKNEFLFTNNEQVIEYLQRNNYKRKQ